ncbi:hypothetical protein CONPUDRAFT_140790 [Coniophora puteana RWD-64-598 SS2]|uniref:Uncharacterized protein n=1 Tax=Coniophora puteana (strain RWD-64-598) TaxID=741705 RepID=A0A5M3N5C6_CONPW|nr:uncharacterized protein CONPUDRAFT_140790 [Coniophora puteana RWD-64-598 SS2]EIW86055.1 hypothetical protein CONPUDRAFT_140790 [Coniophora puteana RWD-64-598 SS2]
MSLASRAYDPTLLLSAEDSASLQITGELLIGGIFYGFMTAVAGICAHSIIQTRQRRTRRRLWLFLMYIAALWTLGTAEMGSITSVMIGTYVLHSQRPQVSPIRMVVNGAAWLAMLLGDGLMIWRFKVIWGSSQFFRYLVLPPVLLYLANVVIGVFTAIIFNMTGQDVWTDAEVSEEQFFTAYWMVSLSLNVYITTLIAGRLYAYRRRFEANIGSVHAMHYTSIGTMLVESCAALVMFTIVLAATYLTNNPAEYMICVVLVQVQIIVPLMVMIRISHGIAWDMTTVSLVENAIDRALGGVTQHELKILDDSMG